METLRQRIRDRAEDYIDREAWERVETANRAVAGSLAVVMEKWSKKAQGIFEQEQG